MGYFGRLHFFFSFQRNLISLFDNFGRSTNFVQLLKAHFTIKKTRTLLFFILKIWEAVQMVEKGNRFLLPSFRTWHDIRLFEGAFKNEKGVSVPPPLSLSLSQSVSPPPQNLSKILIRLLCVYIHSYILGIKKRGGRAFLLLLHGSRSSLLVQVDVQFSSEGRRQRQEEILWMWLTSFTGISNSCWKFLLLLLFSS